MAIRRIIVATIVLVSLTQINRHRAKAIARRLAIGLCRFSLGWLTPRYRLRTGPCIVFAPHQDDETLGCGALIARKRNEGLPVHVVFITDGGASHPGHPRLSSTAISTMRRQEARTALSILGVESGAIHFLDAADGTLNHLLAAQECELVTRITQLLAAIRPDEIFLPCCPDGSSEHDATFGFICRAVGAAGVRPDIWQYPVWSWWNPMLLIERLIFTTGRCRQPTEDFRPIKAHDLEAYRTQTEPTAPWSEPALPADLVRIFNSDEEFYFRYILPPADSPATDPRVI